MSAATIATALLAHQGGWDEVLLIGGPIIAIAGLLMLAKRRVERAAADDEQEPSHDDEAVDPEHSADGRRR